MEEPELIFHDTVPQMYEDLPAAYFWAKKQKVWILDFFRARSDKNYTPTEVYKACLEFKAPFILLTSVRRTITDLTKENKLIKCQWNESRQGQYGRLNRTWRYNTEYLKPLNPKK